MTKKVILCVLLFFFLKYYCVGQNLYFDTTYVKSSFQSSRSIVEVSPNRYFIAGSDNITGDYDISLYIVDQTGEILNTINYGSTGILDVIQDFRKIDSNVFLLTYRSTDSTIVNFIDSVGTILNTFAISSNYGYCESGLMSFDGKLIFLSISGYIIKTDFSGNILWTTNFSDIMPEYIKSAQDSGILFSGHKISTGRLAYGKLDINGDTVWTKQLNEFYKGNSIAVCNDNGLIIGTSSDPVIGSGTLSSIVRTTSLGDTLWTKYYLTSFGNDMVGVVEETADSGFIFCSNHSLQLISGVWEYSIILHKIDEYGNLIWSKTITDAVSALGSNYLQILQANSGYMLFFNRVYPPTFSTPTDFRLMKVDSVGSITSDYITVLNKHFYIYPNPSNGLLYINFDNIFAIGSKLEVIDQYGNIVLTNYVDSNSLIELNFLNFANGIYFCKIYSSDFVSYERIVIVK